MLPAAAVSFELPGQQCLQTAGFDSTNYWVLQVRPCSEDELGQRFIVKDGIQQDVGSKIESLTASAKCLSYSLGARRALAEPFLYLTALHAVSGVLGCSG
jgi:hypothetical protein